jgi:hypothetical protein
MNEDPGRESLTERGRELEDLLTEAKAKPGVADALELQKRMTEVAAASGQVQPPQSVSVADFAPNPPA